MEAGYALDVEVLTKVMGKSLPGCWPDENPDTVLCQWGRHYSRSDADSMRVVDEMVAKGWRFNLEIEPSGSWVRFTRIGNSGFGCARHSNRLVAIAVAALAAFEDAS